MVRPYSREIFIPWSRANKAADPAYNLGADATGLDGVKAGNDNAISRSSTIFIQVITGCEINQKRILNYNL